MNDVSFAYDGSYDAVFERVNLHLDTNWRLGLIGRNGRGKTTLMRLLMGEQQPNGGSISALADFAYFPYEVEDPAAPTGVLIQGLCPQCEGWEISRELSLLDVSDEVLGRPFCTLSNGEQTKLLLAALFLAENRFLLIDEPTNHLDAAARQSVTDYLERKQGFILASHDRDLLDQCVDHILSINQADIEVQHGNYSSWQENRERQDQFEVAEQEKLHREVGRLSEASRRSSGWSDQSEKTKKGTRNAGLRPDRGFIGHKSAKMMKRAKVIEARREKAVEEASKLLKNVEIKQTLKIRPLQHHARILAKFQGACVCYDGKPVFAPVDFSIEQGERVVLAGRNGSGKSSLLKLLMGESLDRTGTFRLASQLKISYVSQDNCGLVGSLEAYTDQWGIDETLFRTILRKLDFSRLQFEKDMSDYSDGQKKKVLLARSLCEEAHLYLWDEPLNFIDIPSRLQIEELILEYQPTLLVVEHDGAFCRRIATKTISLEPPHTH